MDERRRDRRHHSVKAYRMEPFLKSGDARARHGTIEREDTNLFHRTDSVDEAYEIITRHLVEHALTERGAIL